MIQLPLMKERASFSAWLRMGVLLALILTGLAIACFTSWGDLLDKEHLLLLVTELRSLWWAPLLLIGLYSLSVVGWPFGPMLAAFTACIVLQAACVCVSPASAKSLIADDPKDLYHWAYAAAFGTGAYHIGGGAMFAVRFNPRHKLASFADGRFTLNLRLPVTVGLETLDVDEIASTPIAEQFATISFVPGLGLTLPVTSRWTLNPYANYGWGTELQGEASAWIYFTGLNSRFLTRFNRLDLTLLNGVQWLGSNPDNGPEEQFARLINGLEADYPLGSLSLKGHQLYLKPHFVYYWYFDNLDFSVIQQQPVELNQEVEVALAIGTREHIALWLLKFDRVGVGYRRGDEIEGVRLFFDSVFD